MAIQEGQEVGPAGTVQTDKAVKLSLTPLVVSIEEYLVLVGIKRSLGYDLIRKGEVDAVKLGRRTVITVASIEAMLERNKFRRSAK